jgi:hypothetical protein
VTFGVSFVMEITLPTTRAVRSIRTSKKKENYPPLRPKQYTPPAPLRQTLHTQPGITYAQITKPNTCTPTPQNTDHLHTQSQQPPGENHNLKFLMQTLFDQLSATINLLHTVISWLLPIHSSRSNLRCFRLVIVRIVLPCNTILLESIVLVSHWEVSN